MSIHYCPVHGHPHYPAEVCALQRFKRVGDTWKPLDPSEVRYYIVAQGRKTTYKKRGEAWEALCPAEAHRKAGCAA